VVEADITSLDVDAIVNSVDPMLLGRRGVSAAIHAAAGPALRAECRAIGGCKPGDAKITGGHRLKARFVIHAVGPEWGGGSYDEDHVLASCYERSLALARAKGIQTIAFPCISTGAFRYPVAAAARIAVRTVYQALRSTNLPQRVILCGFTPDATAALRSALNEFIA
jgi:O-acetyl-ADP-ribose deacetylase (regulator of RNase III)